MYATSMNGYGVNIHAPRMPYVASTVLLGRPFGWILRPFWRFFYFASQLLFRQLLGVAGFEWDSGADASEMFVDESYSTLGTGFNGYV